MSLQQPVGLPPVKSNPNEIDHEFSQINQQFQDLNLRYQNSYEYGNLGSEAPPSVQPIDVNPVPNYVEPVNHYSYEQHQPTDFYGQQQPQQQMQQQPSPPQQQQQQPQMQYEFTANNAGGYSDQVEHPSQPPTYSDPFAYGAYGASEVN